MTWHSSSRPTVVVRVLHRLSVGLHMLDAHLMGSEDDGEIVDIAGWKLLLIAVLMAVPLVASIITQLDLHQYLVLAAVRCVLQVLALGAVLRFLFAKNAPQWTAAYLLFMMTVSSLEAVSRPSKSYKVCSGDCSLCFLRDDCLLLPSWLAGFYIV